MDRRMDTGNDNTQRPKLASGKKSHIPRHQWVKSFTKQRQTTNTKDWHCTNKANLRDLIAATGLVIFIKFDPNHRLSARVTLKFHGWRWKIIGHLFYITSSLVHHFKSICESKPNLQSGNTQIGSKWVIFCPVWPWNLTDDLKKMIGHLFYIASSFVHHFIAISEFKIELQSQNSQFLSISMFFVPCELEIWQMTLENNRAPLLY